MEAVFMNLRDHSLATHRHVAHWFTAWNEEQNLGTFAKQLTAPMFGAVPWTRRSTVSQLRFLRVDADHVQA
jgi:hypothetical protein